MRITIDTKEDSPKEIKNAIRLLNSILGKKVYSNNPNIFNDEKDETPSTATQNVFGAVFDSPKKPEEEEIKPEPKKEEKEENDLVDIPGVEQYFD